MSDATWRRPIGATLFATLFAFLALLDLVQSAAHLAGFGEQPTNLLVLHLAAGLLAAAAAFGAWTGARWAPLAALGWGLAMVRTIHSVAPLIPADARFGLWIAIWVMGLFAAVAAWYLARFAERR